MSPPWEINKNAYHRVTFKWVQKESEYTIHTSRYFAKPQKGWGLPRLKQKYERKKKLSFPTLSSVWNYNPSIVCFAWNILSGLINWIIVWIRSWNLRTHAWRVTIYNHGFIITIFVTVIFTIIYNLKHKKKIQSNIITAFKFNESGRSSDCYLATI